MTRSVEATPTYIDPAATAQVCRSFGAVSAIMGMGKHSCSSLEGRGVPRYDGFAIVTVKEARLILGGIAAFWTGWLIMAWGFRTGDGRFLLAAVPAFASFGLLAWTCARVGARATGRDVAELLISGDSFAHQVVSVGGLRRLARCAGWPVIVVYAMYGVLALGIAVFTTLFLFPPAGE
jgi:hypothetical protein